MNERLGNVEFLVRRGDIRDVRFVAAPTEYQIDLASDQVLLKIAKFGFTSNNVTYATLGEAMRYWDFFPAPEGWAEYPFGVTPMSHGRPIPRSLKVSASRISADVGSSRGRVLTVHAEPTEIYLG